MEVNVQILAQQAGINLDEITSEIEAQFQIALRKVATAAYGEVIRLATERLDETKQTYIKGLRFENVDQNTYLIQLADNNAEPHGLPPTWLEGGWAKFGMKPGLLNGPRSRSRKDGGRYNIVPFKQSVGGSPPRTLGQAVLQQGLKAIIKEKKLSQIVKDTAGRPMQGPVARVRTVGKKANISERTKHILGSHARYLDGLTKYQKTYNATTQGQLMTFRAVSDRSAPSSWIHPGWKGAHIFDDVGKYVEDEVKSIMTSILR